MKGVSTRYNSTWSPNQLALYLKLHQRILSIDGKTHQYCRTALETALALVCFFKRAFSLKQSFLKCYFFFYMKITEICSLVTLNHENSVIRSLRRCSPFGDVHILTFSHSDWVRGGLLPELAGGLRDMTHTGRCLPWLSLRTLQLQNQTH